MRQILTISVMAALALGLAAYTSDAGQRKGGTGGGDQVQQIDQQRDEDRLRSRVETQDMVRLRDEEIYGHELMTKEELNQYRKKLQTMRTPQAREQFQMQHEEKMRVRALQQNREIVPPGQGPIYRGDMMSAQERNEYREQLRRIETEEERARFLARHREEMDQRAELADEETEEAE